MLLFSEQMRSTCALHEVTQGSLKPTRSSGSLVSQGDRTFRVNVLLEALCAGHRRRDYMVDFTGYDDADVNILAESYRLQNEQCNCKSGNPPT